MFLFAAGVILASAEPFADGLIHTGEKLGIDKFLLVQWLAPLASEAPEMIIAILFVLRAKPASGLGTLVSSKVNQWSLLIATIPLVYAIAHRSFAAMPLDGQQVEEVFLTAAQSAFAVAVLASLSISRGEAMMLLVPVPRTVRVPQHDGPMGVLRASTSRRSPTSSSGEPRRGRDSSGRCVRRCLVRPGGRRSG